ncbi:hypothetical protein JTE90_018676 [Oedothorax gibbosus]|uniref:Reverse transcriptase domain-containing protein n=1 Tax=Oedothorax gibbosus TaxID=931172 RepID=A0AAV6UZP9_9ARAC|nr:hypothetical protein JTE90_018676 [Oedothorax gibbosus]
MPVYDDDDIEIYPALVKKDSRNETHILISNVTNKIVQLKEGTKIAEIERQLEDVKLQEVRAKRRQTLKESHFQLNHLNSHDRKKVSKLLMEYADVFSVEMATLGKTNIIQPEFSVRDDELRSGKYFPVPQALKSILRDQLDEMLQADIIEKSDSYITFPCIMVKKKSKPNTAQAYRLCVDFRSLNQLISYSNHPLPLAYAEIDKISGFSPYLIMFGQEPNLPHTVKLQEENKQANLPIVVESKLKTMAEIQQLVTANCKEATGKQQEYRLHKKAELRDFQRGEKVWERLGAVNYRVIEANRPNAKPQVIHAHRIIKFTERLPHLRLQTDSSQTKPKSLAQEIRKEYPSYNEEYDEGEEQLPLQLLLQGTHNTSQQNHTPSHIHNTPQYQVQTPAAQRTPHSPAPHSPHFLQTTPKLTVTRENEPQSQQDKREPRDTTYEQSSRQEGERIQSQIQEIHDAQESPNQLEIEDENTIEYDVSQYTDNRSRYNLRPRQHEQRDLNLGEKLLHWALEVTKP